MDQPAQPVEFSTRDALADAASDWIARHLETALTDRGQANLLLSGGSTPGPVYERLSHRALDWAKVNVGLCDERWVDEDDPASNARLVHEHLLQNRAAAARFYPMKTAHEDPREAVTTVEALYEPLLYPSDVMVLGMGPDAHTLSWFAGAEGFEAATDPGALRPVEAIDAPQTDITGPHTKRMTLTYRSVSHCRHLLLAITGDAKRDALAQAGPDAAISILRRAAGDALTIYHAP